MRRTNYDHVYHALKIYRDAMLTFLVECLRNEFHEDGWWREGVKRALGESVTAELENAYKRRYQKPLSSVSLRSSELSEMLDINRFQPIIEKHWRLFEPTFKQRDTIVVWLREINDIRNVVAHPEHGDLSDDDRIRALDTMQRTLKLIDPAAAEEINEIRNSPERAAALAGFALGENYFDYDRAIAEIEDAILSTDPDHEDLTELQKLRRTLGVVFNEARLGKTGVHLDEFKHDTLARLQGLAQKYLGQDLVAVALIDTPPSTPAEALMRLASLDDQISVLRQQQHQVEQRVLGQQAFGEPGSRMAASIRTLKRQIERAESERALIRASGAPPTFLRVRRGVVGEKARPTVDTPIRIVLEITNLGSSAAFVQIDERLGDLLLCDGTTVFRGEIAAGARVHHEYQCLALTAGRHMLEAPSLAYEGRSEEWDDLPSTVLNVESGSPAEVEVRRYYRHMSGGIAVFAVLTNRGERTARKVRYTERVRARGETRERTVRFQADLPGLSTVHTEAEVIGVIDAERISMPEETICQWHDSLAGERHVAVTGVPELFAYGYPTHADVVEIAGQEKHLATIRALLRQFIVGSRNTIELPLRLLVIEGLEGAGKTRLVHELVRIAEESSLRVIAEDLVNSRPIHRLLCRLLNLPLDVFDQEEIAAALEESLPGVERVATRRVLKEFLANVSGVVPFEQFTSVATNIIGTFKTLSRDRPLVVILENLHAARIDDLTEALLRSLLDAILGSSDHIFVCVTYRPGEQKRELLPSFTRTPPKIEVAPLDAAAIRLIADRIVPFPRFSSTAANQLYLWSRGNPLYLIEILRWLLTGEKHVRRFGGVWELALGVDVEDIQTKELTDIISLRLTSDLGSSAPFARLLAAIGFQIPRKVAERFAAERLQWTPAQVDDAVRNLIAAGILVWRGSDSGVIEFEHSVKHKVIYQSIDERTRQQYHEQIADILHERLYSSTDQSRWLPRHILRSSRDYQLRNIEPLLAEARSAVDRRDTSAALAMLKALETLVSDRSVEAVDVQILKCELYNTLGQTHAAEVALGQALTLLHAQKLPRANKRKVLVQIAKQRAVLAAAERQHDARTAERLLRSARRDIQGIFGWRRLTRGFDTYREDLVDVEVTFADICLRRGQFLRCERACRRAERHAQHPGALAAVFRRFGRLSFEQHRYEIARRWYDKALEKAQAADDQYERGRILTARAELRARIKDTDAAIRDFEAALELQQKLGDEEGITASFFGLAELHDHAASIERAIYFYDLALAKRDFVADVFLVATGGSALARLYHRSHNDEKSKETWLDVRTLLIDQLLLRKLPLTEHNVIVEFLKSLVAATDAASDAKRFAILTSDLVSAEELAGVSGIELAAARVQHAEAALRIGDWRSAIEEIEHTVSVTTLAARSHALLGDVYANFPEASADWTRKEDPAILHYRTAIEMSIRKSEISRALTVYERLLRYVTTSIDQTKQLAELPTLVAHFIDALQNSFDYQRELVDRAILVLEKSGHLSAAGDIAAGAVKKWSAHGTSQAHPLLQRYLARAEALYRRCSPRELFDGLDMLVSAYAVRDAWHEITRCVQEMLGIAFDLRDVREAMGVLDDVAVLVDRISNEQLQGFVDTVYERIDTLKPIRSDRHHLLVTAAKLVAALAERSKGEQREAMESRLLEIYDEVIDSGPVQPAVLSVLYNDSSMIYQNRKQYDEALLRLNESIRLDHGSSVGVSYANRAALRLAIDPNDNAGAMADYETAFDVLRREKAKFDVWQAQPGQRERRSRRDMTRLLYVNDRFISICAAYAGFLMSCGEGRRAQMLIAEAQSTQGRLHLYHDRLQETLLPIQALTSGRMQLLDELNARLGDYASVCPQCQAEMLAGDSKCPNCGFGEKITGDGDLPAGDNHA